MEKELDKQLNLINFYRTHIKFMRDTIKSYDAYLEIETDDIIKEEMKNLKEFFNSKLKYFELCLETYSKDMINNYLDITKN